MAELKKCPFCGSKARLLHGFEGITRTSYVECENLECHAQTKAFSVSAAYTSDEKAVEVWNKRVDDGV